jgi:hypothetical protein
VVSFDAGPRLGGGGPVALMYRFRVVRAVRLKHEVETLGDVVGPATSSAAPRNAHVADQAVNRAASELNRARHQYRLARDSASFHEP